MFNFLKGIVIGIGGIAPGLSGSVLLVIFGLYQKTVDAIGTFFKDIKGNLKLLLPLAIGMGIGVVAFSRAVDFLLSNAEVYTRFAFLGLIVGTLPLLYKEVKKEGFRPIYYLVMALSAAFGFWLLYANSNLFGAVSNPSLAQSVLLGLAVAGSYIVPGVDSAAILNALGLYDIWIKITSLQLLDLKVLIPVAVGLLVGVLGISFVIGRLLKRFYTATFSVIFGLFISVIPSVLVEMKAPVNLGLNLTTAGAVFAALLGLLASLYLGDIKNNNRKIKKLLKK